MGEEQNESWQEWLRVQRTASTMTVDLIPLAQVRGWGMTPAGEQFGRPDGKFFRMVGACIAVPKEGQREVTSWDQPLLDEYGVGAVVLFRARGAARYLLAARAEPGNDRPGCVLLGPPLQASLANLERAHGGTRPPRAEVVDGLMMPWVRFPQDGGRFYRKANAFAVIEVDPAALEPLRPNERWFTEDELREALLHGELNEHLIQAVALAMLA